MSASLDVVGYVASMRDLTYPPIIVAARTAFKVLGITIEITGAEHIPRTGPAILAMNHISYVDFVFGGLAARPSKRLVRFMAKRELFDHKLTGPLMRSLHHIEVDREAGSQSYRTALQYLRDGEVVGVFPEATISRSFELKEFKSGVTRMARATKSPVIPVVLWGTHRMMTKDHPRDFSRGHVFDISVGAPIVVTTDPDGSLAELRTTMAAMLDAAIARHPKTEPGAWWVPARLGGSAPTPEQAEVLDAEERARRHSP